MNNFITVLKKELTDILRDRKTIAFTILLPILIYPVMFKVMGTTIKSGEKDAEKEIRLVIEGDTDSSLVQILKSQNNITIKNIEDPSKALKDGEIELIVNLPKNIDKNIAENKETKIELLVDDQSDKSTIAAGMVNTLFDNYSKQVVQQRLNGLGVESTILTPFSIEQKSGISEDGKMNSAANMLMGMLPGMIVLFLLTPTVGLAADMGAGEKERGTFEPLLSTSGNRNSLLWGKIASMAIIAVVALIASMISLSVSFKGYIASVAGTEISLDINSKAIAVVILFAIFIIVAICTLQIGISIYARSTKEANTYLSGLLIPMMLLVFVPMYMNVKSIKEIFFHIPLINAVCVMKESLFGIYNLQHILMVLGWHILYIIVIVTITKYMFSREEVVFRS
ncbi:ABC transporter permease [Clostridium sp. SHJSY1]|uniref:ABC transporter permease n=1 Tax=Clostridium sp. SHJSY1 TaxID=2942483 RepID=UPI002875520B|nr:ABC transporter permease [Clostridium sp. SHJSY1]MDS0527529.1 ABC transporter permease [Clostridium sp. SHJSY1]